jgi:two-component system sensor histidine kinase KdpD
MADAHEEVRPDPEAILARVMREEREAAHGRMKLFLGFAAGVGKTYEMLNEAQRRRARGQDVVIGYVETHSRKGTESQIADLEVIPRKKIQYRDSTFEEMDVDAVIRRRPQWVLVDELAHTNIPGSERAKRWQDVDAIRAAGISVLSTMNVQHMESLNNTVYEITGVWVRETVPDQIVASATEVVMVDITPRALIHRLERGDIYTPEKVPRALGNWFREGNLAALREMALREIAHEVDEDLTTYRKEKQVQKPWPATDRVMVCVSATRSSLRLIRQGWRIAQRLKGEIVAVYVDDGASGPHQKEALASNLALAQRLEIPVITLHGNVIREILFYAREHSITHIVIGHSTRSRWHELLHGSLINALARMLRSINIIIVASEEIE